MSGSHEGPSYQRLLCILLFFGGIAFSIATIGLYAGEHRSLMYTALLCVCLSPFAVYVEYARKDRPFWYLLAILWITASLYVAVWGGAYLIGIDDPLFKGIRIGRSWQVAIACVCFTVSHIVCETSTHRFASGKNASSYKAVG